MSRSLYRLGRFSVRRRWLVLAVWIAVLVGLGVVGKAAGGTAVDDFTIPGTETQRAADLLKQKFPEQSGSQARVVFAVQDGTLAAPAVQRGITDLLAEAADQPHVVGTDAPNVATTSKDGRIGFATVDYDDNPAELGTEPGKRLQELAEPLRAQGVTVEFGGNIQLRQTELGGSSEGIGLLVAVFVLLLAFGSVVAMGLPLGTALVGLGAGLSLITLGESVFHIPTIAPTLATMIGLGVGIDYALFIVTRHREQLHGGHTVEDAAGRAIATAGQAVVFAGTTVVIAICGLQFVGIPLVAMMGYATAAVVAVSVVAAITLLPALMGFAGHNIDKLRLPGVKVAAGGEEHSVASRWSHHVARHPWRYLLGSLALLGVLIVPFFSIHLGQTDAGNDPKTSTTRKSYDLLAEGFGKGFNSQIVVVVEKGSGSLDGSVAAVQRAISADPGVALVAPKATVNPAGDVAVLAVFPTTSPQDEATEQLVHRLRGKVLPPAVQASGAQDALVSGSTAAFIDISQKISSRLPVFIGAVLLMSFLLLMVVFRSILVPLKAALMNLLGIAAAYGVIVAVFQWQWGAGLFGVEESLPIVAFLPMFMFAILFGLSMDYEVFLMSRIREEYLHTHDNTRSVGTGISHTARVITAAAIIMVSVFGSFALGDDHTVQMMGVGLAVAILLDATVIRMVLVPSTMQLLGDRNWWLPGWLDRILPNLDIEGGSGLPPAEWEPGKGPDAEALEADDDDEPERELVGAGR